MKFTKLICGVFLSLAAITVAQPAQARIYLDISSAELRKVSMAVPYFVDKQIPGSPGTIGKALADTMSQGLTFHGFITLIPPEKFGGRQDADWTEIGAEFTVVGQYITEPDGIMLELRLLDDTNGRMILGRRYRGTLAKKEQMVLRFCDEIILKLTGEKGISLTKIAFVSNESGYGEIYISDVLGGKVRQVTRHNSITVSPRFSPDGTMISYTSYHRKHPYLYVTKLDQSRVTRPLSRRKGLNMAAAWAPSGDKLAITLSKDGNPDLFLMDTRGKILRKLTRNEGINVSPSWSPDGKKLAFVSDRSGSPQIYIMTLRNRTVKRITYLGNYNTTPSWSPKGDLIAYSGFYEGSYHIYTISPKAGTPTRLTKYWGDHESPSWSPDGRQIVFSRRRKDVQKICAIFKNGEGMRVLFKDRKGKQSYPQWSPRKKL